MGSFFVEPLGGALDCADLIVEPNANKTCIATFSLNPTPDPTPDPMDPTPMPTVPAMPVNVVASAIGGEVTASFMPAPGLIGPTGRRDPATSFRVELGSGPGLTDKGIFDVGNTTTGTVSLEPDPYVMAVRGVNGVGVGPRSLEVSFTVPCIAAPGVPGNLRATIVGSTVTLTWDRSTSCGASTYLGFPICPPRMAPLYT